MPNFGSIIALIMQLFGLVGIVKDALRAGESVLEILKKHAPAFIQYIQDAGKALFPNLNQEDQVQAGALVIDPDAVKVIQSAMNKLGQTPPLIVDGSYGKLTKAAVEAFQRANGLEVDGWAGKLTSAVMQVALAKLEAPAAMAKVTEAQAVPAK